VWKEQFVSQRLLIYDFSNWMQNLLGVKERSVNVSGQIGAQCRSMSYNRNCASYRWIKQFYFDNSLYVAGHSFSWDDMQPTE